MKHLPDDPRPDGESDAADQDRAAAPSGVAALRPITKKAVILLALQAIVFAGVLFAAFVTRHDFRVDDAWLETFWRVLPLFVAVKLAVFYVLGHCHVSWRQVAFADLTRLIWAATLSMLVIAAAEQLVFSTGRLGVFPRVRASVVVLDWAGTVLAIGGIRALWRSVREELSPILTGKPIKTALIIGADTAGQLTARTLQAAQHVQYHIAGFLDDDAALHQTRVAGIPVIGSVESALQLMQRRPVDEVVVRSGSLTGKRIRRLLDDCATVNARLNVIPAVDELLVGEGSDALFKPRPVEIKDLLRREPVVLDDAAVRTLIEGRTVMVTGAGGSIGSEICRQALRFGPGRLLLVERGENALFLVEQEFRRIVPEPPFEPLVADITDEPRMERLMEVYRPDVIFHAAAHKHVPMMEWNPAEAIKNNCLGTQLLARLADRHGVREFVMISTDKAVNPTSVMGCSKLIAERFVQALSTESRTKFIVVRFGNVLASNGSVVPIFQEQIRRGGPVTVTHEGISRYFMMIPEASQLVLQAAAMGQGGEIFVLDMGESVKIVDLARDLIALSGLGEDDIDIVFTGLRPGEKLYEELYFDGEERVNTSHAKVFCALHRPTTLAAVEDTLDELTAVLNEPPEVVKARLHELVPEYSSPDRPVVGAAVPRSVHAK
jgi:FlaA1/EpsC-like NDP-sugar epimerase